MPNYKETTVNGVSYQRAHRMILENRLNDVPHITFLEEEVMTINGQEIRREGADQVTIYFAPDGQFPLWNPVTESPAGGYGTHVELQTLLYSLYQKAIADRDAAKAAP